MPNYNKLTPELISQIKAAVKGTVYEGGDINEDYKKDEMPIYGTNMPDLAVVAQSTEDVAAIVKICSDHKIPVPPRGAGTGLVGAAVPVAGGVLIDMSKMNRILSYDLENMVVTIEPGVLLQDLADDCSKQGLMYPPDPGEKLACVGGNVATNAGGMRAVKYGTTRDYVRAMTVVLPTGEITHFGAKVSKTSSGYSLIDLMIGSEGTLGIITELTLKIIPAPKFITSMIVPFPDLKAAISNVPLIKNANLDPQALEFMEKEALLASERYIGKSTFPKEVDGVPANAYLLITFDADTEDIINSKIEQAVNIVMDNGAIDVLIADTPPKMKDAWAARSSLLDAILEETKLLDECDVVVPVNEIADFLTFATKTGEECGLIIKSFGHAGDGNLHIYQCSNDLDEEEFKKRVEKYFHILYKKATEVGGLVSGEHGIGLGKIKFLEESIGKKNMELMYGIKKVFDPNLILNPGKVSYELGKEETREAAIPAFSAGGPAAAGPGLTGQNETLNQAAASVAQAAASVAQAAASIAQAALGQSVTPVQAPAGAVQAAAPTAPKETSGTAAPKAEAPKAAPAPKKEEKPAAKPKLKGIAALKAELAAKKNNAGKAGLQKAAAKKKETPKAAAPKDATPAAPADEGTAKTKALNICVCVKQVPDTTEIKIDPVKNTLIRDGVPSILNTFDGYALEAAARLKDKNPNIKIYAICMGPAQAKAVLKESLAICADKAFLISGRQFGGSDTLATSYIISEAVKMVEKREGIHFDMIFCGKQAIDGDTAQVGPEMAEHLGYPQVTYGLECKETEDEMGLIVTQEGDDGRNIIEVSMPCLVTFTKPSYDPRFPTVKRKLAANKAEIPTITDSEEDFPEIDRTRIGLKGSPTKVKKTYTPPQKEGGVRFEKVNDDDTPDVLAGKLYAALSEAHVL